MSLNYIGAGLFAAFLALVLLPVSAAAAQPQPAAPPPQTDPVAQCAEGVQLFVAGQKAEALPLLA